MPSFFDLMKYAKTGIASPDMTGFDKLRSLAAFGGYSVSTITGVPPISFKADGTPLTAWSIAGNGQQTGIPTPDAPIMPEFVGTLDNTDWTIPITCAGQTVPVYLGQTQTVRKIKKLVLTGEESWTKSSTYQGSFYARLIDNSGAGSAPNNYGAICSHAVKTPAINVQGFVYGKFAFDGGTNPYNLNLFIGEASWSVSDFQQYLAQQYSNGTPVTVWYVLATPETAIVNEPLCKIGDYADELHSTDAGVTIPTVRGNNTLTVDTDLQPSSMSVTGRIKPS